MMLDARAGEELGCDPGIYELMADAKMPRNLNDSDISFDMKELPESRIGCTDMSVWSYNLDIVEAGTDCHSLS